MIVVRPHWRDFFRQLATMPAAETQARREALRVRAPQAGRIVDLPDTLQPGDWVAPERELGRIVGPERLDAHKLIEEYMIQANVAAAETLEKARVPLLYRIHDAPSHNAKASKKSVTGTP
mgnify:CR=1 FL=1